MLKQRSAVKAILSGPPIDVSHSRPGVIGKEDHSTVIANVHISLLSDFLDQIHFPMFLQKNWRHPSTQEMTGDFATKCLILSRTPSGRKYACNTKIWVVTLVCKGTSVCEPAPHHGPTSPRRHCGYGLRIYARNSDPTTVILEEFGKHQDGWKFCPPNDERVKLTPSMIIDAYRYDCVWDYNSFDYIFNNFASEHLTGEINQQNIFN